MTSKTVSVILSQVKRKHSHIAALDLWGWTCTKTLRDHTTGLDTSVRLSRPAYVCGLEVWVEGRNHVNLDMEGLGEVLSWLLCLLLLTKEGVSCRHPGMHLSGT